MNLGLQAGGENMFAIFPNLTWTVKKNGKKNGKKKISHRAATEISQLSLPNKTDAITEES